MNSYHLVPLFFQPVMKVSMQALAHTCTHAHMYIYTHQDKRRNRLIPLIQIYTHMRTHTHTHIQIHTHQDMRRNRLIPLLQ